MRNSWRTRGAVALWLSGTLATSAAAYDQTFLITDYSKLQTRSLGGIKDAAYLAPDIRDKFKNYNSIAVDQPEVLISPQSDYKGAKQDDLAKVAENLRLALTDRLTAGGYNLVQQSGPNVLYVRLALTDLELKKKKRNILAYTPVGAVVKAGADALRSVLDKYDITGMTLQGEVVDSVSNEVLAAIVVPWPGEKKRLEFGDLDKILSEYGERIRCNLDNARNPTGTQVDCFDPKARAARESAGKPGT